jgi:hypothetical protein
VYTDVLKKTALQYGPNSPEVMRALIDLDDVFQVKFLLLYKKENKELCQKIQDLQYFSEKQRRRKLISYLCPQATKFSLFIF